MTTTAEAAKMVSGHTPISNLPEEVTSEAVGKPVSTPPSEGPDPGSSPITDEVSEAIKPSRREELAAAELFTAPIDKGLRDIGEASFGTPAPIMETIHGADNRVQVTSTTIYPWRAISSLLITAADPSMWIGTGWFIGPHTVMTAGHVVYIKNSNVPGRDGWVKKIQVMPGRNGSKLPYGSVTSTSFRSVTGWTKSGDENFDFGAIILPTELGKIVGTFGFSVYSDADLVSCVGNRSGYPGDKPTGTQWYDYHKIASVNSRKVFYDIDTAGGQSGAPVYRIISVARIAIAIHAYGAATTNSGTRIISAVYNNMLAWKA
jgi:glutamyl endopeptidase